MGKAGVPSWDVEKHFHERSVEPQVPPLRSPGFPVEVGGAGNSMRLSLEKGAHAALSRVARQEIRVRSGPTARRGRRDDKGEGNGCIESGCRLSELQIRLAQSKNISRTRRLWDG